MKSKPVEVYVSNLSLFVNNIDADDLVTPRSRASAAILLT